MSFPSYDGYTDAEHEMIGNEPPGLFPADQESNWGKTRKVFADQLQFLADTLSQEYDDLDPRTASADALYLWEQQLGIPVGTARTIEARRAFIQARMVRGAFSRERRNAVIESFIAATFGSALAFGPDGIELLPGGTIFSADPVPITSAYRVYENIRGFTYEVRIDSTITPDIAGLTRELKRISPIPFTINNSLSGTAMLDYAKDVMNDGPILRLPMAGNANDASGYANNGSVYGSAVATAGLLPNISGAGQALTFDGVDDYIGVPTAPNLILGNSYTIEFTFSLAGFPTTGHAAYFWLANGHSAAYTDPAGNLGLIDGAGHYAFANAAFVTGTTYTVQVRVRNGVPTLKINNVAKPYTTNGPLLMPAPVPLAIAIGGAGAADTYVTGKMDELSVFAKGLSDARLISHYNTAQNIA